MLLFGFSLIYIMSGTLSFETLQKLLNEPIFFNLNLIGILFISLALLFKIGAFPLHS